MRLIHTTTLGLSEFLDDEIPAYAILSHRWGKDEVSFKDYRKGRNNHGAGYEKIVRSCWWAKRFELEWIWIDTACIDTRSSAELSEAINSMFRWYEEAEVCFAHLADVPSSFENIESAKRLFMDSSWFTRGWTLQELIAPEYVVFLTDSWEILGRKTERRPGCQYFSSLTKEGSTQLICPCSPVEKGYIYRLSEGDLLTPDQILECLELRTRVPSIVLGDQFHYLHTQSVAQKMSWASERQTTRTEDRAYCLLGIFELNMPLHYGEGDRAFERLQIEILRSSPDETIFAWDPYFWFGHDDSKRLESSRCLLASSPEFFKSSGNILQQLKGHRTPYNVTNDGLELELSPIPDGTLPLMAQRPSQYWQSVEHTHLYVPVHCTDGDTGDIYVMQLVLKQCGHYEVLLPMGTMSQIHNTLQQADYKVGEIHLTIYLHLSRRQVDRCAIRLGTRTS